MMKNYEPSAIKLFYDTKRLKSGLPAYISWQASNESQHHWLIGGNSGSGKSTHLALSLAKIARHLPTARLYLMDFKGSDDNSYLRDVPNARYFAHEKCVDGLRAFSEEIETRLQDNPDRTPLFAVFDEYSSFISYTSIADKKLASQCQMWMMNALFMSRSVGGYCWLCTQRPGQSIMPSGGARDQFGARIWWGRFSSPDAKKMMFGDMTVPENYVGGVGRGLLYMDGQGEVVEVTAPRPRRIETVKEAIRDFVTR